MLYMFRKSSRAWVLRMFFFLTLVSAVLLMRIRSLSAVWESPEQLVFLIDCRLTAESGQ